MMSFNCSQNSQSLSFVSSKHNTHDETWLLPGVTSSFFCFACTIECLEDKSTLNIRKKKIATEFLEVLLVNKNIGRVVGSKQDVYFHLLNLYVILLWESTDQEFKDIIIQCCLHTVKQTNPLHACPIILENILERKCYAENLHLLKLLCLLLQLTPSLSDVFFHRKGAYIEEIIKCTSGCNNSNLIYSWNLIALIFQSGVKNENNQIPKERVQSIITSGLDTINTSFVAGVEIYILHCLQYFSESRYYRMILFEHECSKLTSSLHSVVEVLKKMLLSSKEDLELNAVHCISSICDPSYETASENPELASLVSLVLEKGLSEFLLELLASAGDIVICELFKCLFKLTYSKAFCKMGHMVYGFTAIINAIKKVEKSSNLDAFYEGLVLLESMLTKGIFLDHRNQLVKQSCTILDLLNCAFMKPLSKLKYVVVSCFSVYLGFIPSLVRTDFETTLNMIESIFTYMEKEIKIINSNVDKKMVEFIVHSYEAVFFLIQIISKESVKVEKMKGTQETNVSSNSSQLSQHLDSNLLSAIVDNIYFICDKYLIPQAVMKFFQLNSIPLQSVFYRTLLSIIELSTEKGKLLAHKLAESSFLRFLFDFKIFASRTVKDINEVISKLLVCLCLSVETYIVDDWIQKSLMTWFNKFNIPFKEWQLLLVQSPLSNQMTSDFLGEARSCIFALLAYSQKASSPLISMNLLKSPLETFADSKDNLFSLPILGKRYFLYLWSHMECLHANMAIKECSLKYTISMVENESERAKNLFMNSDVILIWMIKNNLSLDVRKSFFGLFFNDIINLNDFDERMQVLITTVNLRGIAFQFIDILLSSIESCSDSILDIIISMFVTLLNSVSSNDIDSLKISIYKSLMKNRTGMDHTQLTALFKCSVEIQIACGRNMNDDDLKLLCKSLNLLSEHTSPSLKFQLLRFVNILIAKSVKMLDAKPSSVTLGCKELLTDLQSSIFTNSSFVSNSQSSCLLENINAVSIMIISELLSGVQLLATYSNEVMKVDINLSIEALVAHQVPVIQIAMLAFWKKMFECKFQSPLIEFINTSDVHKVTQKDIDLLYIALQNLYYNPKELIREHSIVCLCSLMDALSDPVRLVNQPWTKTLIEICTERLSFEGKDVASLNLLKMYIKHKKLCNEKTYNMVMELLKQCIEENDIQVKGIYETICLGEIVIKAYIEKIDYSKLKDLKIFLKSLYHKFSKSASGLDNENMNFISINELVILKENVESVQALECIRKTKMSVCEQISAIDDETDSGEEDE